MQKYIEKCYENIHHLIMNTNCYCKYSANVKDTLVKTYLDYYGIISSFTRFNISTLIYTDSIHHRLSA